MHLLHILLVLAQGTTPTPEPTLIVTTVATAAGSGGGSTTIAVPPDLAGILLAAAGVGVIAATSGKTVVSIISSLGVTVPRWLEALTRKKEVETSALADMQKILEEARALIDTANESSSIWKKRYRQLRHDVREQGERHDRDINEIRSKYEAINNLYTEQGVTLKTSKDRVMALELENQQLKTENEIERQKREAAEAARDAALLLAEAAEKAVAEYKRLYELANNNYEALKKRTIPETPSASPESTTQSESMVQGDTPNA